MARLLIFSLALTLAARPAASAAGALGVSPVGFDVPADARAMILKVSNEGGAPLTVQVRAFKWTQMEGVDLLAATSDMVVSPPFAHLSAHSEQIVRIIRPQSPTGSDETAGDGEKSYRVIVDELPEVNVTGAAPTVTLLMRHSIPLFVASGAFARAEVAWRVQPAASAATLIASNAGARRERIANLVVRDAYGHIVTQRQGLVGYVLAHSTGRWPLPPLSPAIKFPLRVTADTDQGALDATVPPPTP